jgi:hypothetical protein
VEGDYHSFLSRLVFLHSVRRLLVAACVVPSSPIFVTLMKEAPGYSETPVLTRATRRNNPEDTILHSHRRENLKSYIIEPVRKMSHGIFGNNYHEISLLSTSHKMLSIILLSRLSSYTYEITGDHQCGFRLIKSSNDQIFCFCQIMKNKMGVQWDSTSAIHRCKIWGFHGGDYEEWSLLGC